MRKLQPILILICIHFVVLAADAQSAKFDIATYTAPAGWAVDKDENAIRFTKESNGNFCVIAYSGGGWAW